MKNFDPKEHVGLLVKFINGRVVNKINKNLSKFNLTRVQHEILCFIDKNEHEGDVTEKGKGVICNSFKFGANNIEKQLVKDMTDEEIKILKDLLSRALKNMEE